MNDCPFYRILSDSAKKRFDGLKIRKAESDQCDSVKPNFKPDIKPNQFARDNAVSERPDPVAMAWQEVLNEADEVRL